MYNRYIPQSDGTHRRRAVQENISPPPPPPNPAPSMQPAPPKDAPVYHEPLPYFGIGNFFRQILPKDFDIADLIVVLLLLLMAADKQEEQNNALLTMALYLFL